jgi:hypothetical protein
MGFANTSLRRCGCWALALLCPAGAAHSAGLVSERPNYFPIGVWQQPTNSFSKWSARGINTVMEVPEGHNLAAWSDAAVRSGFYMLRQPDNGAKPTDAAAVAAARRADLTKYRSNLLAWTMPDEPDFNAISTADLRADYRALKAVDPKNPPKVLMNFSGGTVLGTGTRTGDNVPNIRYQRYLEATDWVSNDIYPVTGWGRSDWIDYSKPAADRKTTGLATDKLRVLSGNKPQLAVLETSDQNLAWVPGDHGVNRAQFRGQLWHSIIHGAQGIVYFPFQFKERFTFDATPADVAEEMMVQHARLQRLASVINAPRDPKTLGFVAGSKKAAQLLEVTWRRGRGADYFFVLNMSGTKADLPFDLTGVNGDGVIHGENRTLRDDDAGTYHDRFAPWEMHVYKFAHPLGGVSRLRAVAVPEPSALGAVACLGGLLLRRRRKI